MKETLEQKIQYIKDVRNTLREMSRYIPCIKEGETDSNIRENLYAAEVLIDKAEEQLGYAWQEFQEVLNHTRALGAGA
jgi:hypothetical protein